MCFYEIALRVRHHHHSSGGGLSPKAAVILFIFLAVCGIIVYFSIRLKKNSIMKGLGYDDETDYRIFKESCPFKYRNSFYMS